MNDEARLVVPALDPEPWPSLGFELRDWLEASLVYGPGDLLGLSYKVSDEFFLFLLRAYEIFPREHPRAGRRRFKRAFLSRRKGLAKTEFAAILALAELHPDAPVRCDGWRQEDSEWIPVGRGVIDPYIPMLAYTEEQAEDLAYRAAYEIATRSPIADDFDVALERIGLRDYPGKITALAGSPSARDGARTTFQHFDESHRMIANRLKQAHATMLRNIPKRMIADAWSLETSTMYGPGEGSIAEESHAYALAVLRGEIEDPDLLFDHRQASERHDITTKRGLLAALKEASGDAWPWTDADALIALFRDPNTDENENRRYWLNQRRRSSKRWLQAGVFEDLAAKRQVEQGAEIVFSLDGSYRRDSTALVGATIEEHPHVFVIAVWERPITARANWRVKRNDVIDAIESVMDEGRYTVREFAPDPPGWHREVEDMEEKYGDVVVRFDTNQPTRMGPAVDDFEQAVRDAELSHDGSEQMIRHVGNCVPRPRGRWTLVDTDEPESPNKIDVATAAIVAHHRARWHYVHAQEAPRWRPL